MYKSMNNYFGIFAALLLLVAAPAPGIRPGFGQDDESSKLGRRLSTAFDEGVIAYAHINLKKLDLGKVEKKLNQWLELPVSISLKNLQPTKKVIEDAGGERVFISYSLNGMDSLPTIAIPMEKEIDTSIIVSVVKSLAEFEVRYLQDSKLLVLAPPTFFKSFESGRLRVRRDVADLIRTKSAEVASINFAPTADHRRVLREFEPQFSDPFSRFDGELLGRSVKAASVVLESIEPFELKVGIRSEDQKSAENLKEAFSQLMKKLPGDNPELNFFRKLEQSFKFSRNTPGLSLRIGPEQEDDWKKAIMPFFVKAKLEVQQSDEVNNLKHMLLGLHNFHDTYRGFPDLGRPKDNGSPGLSWRVHILPFIEETELYEQFRLDEPWDSPHNKKLIAKIPNVFQVANADVPEGYTTYVMPRGSGFFASPFVKKGAAVKKGFRGRQFRTILDGTSNTIAVLQVASDKAVVWTKPEDWTPDKENLLDAIKENGRNRLLFATADGAVHQMPLSKVTAKRFLSWLTIAGGEAVRFD